MPPLHILWRDEHLVAVYKPAGWLVHRTGLDAGETRFVMQTLRDQLGQHVYPVHRLDKGTCGVLVMALHSAAARALSQAFEHQATTKRYLAMVRGWAPESVEVDHALKPDDAPADAAVQNAHTRLSRLAQLTLPEASDARFATTRASLVEAVPTTGRRHQIRRHLKHLAHPILGKRPGTWPRTRGQRHRHVRTAAVHRSLPRCHAFFRTQGPTLETMHVDFGARS